MPRNKKVEDAAIDEVKVEPVVEEKKAAPRAAEVSAAVIVGEKSGKEIMRYTRAVHGPEFARMADDFIAKFNKPGSVDGYEFRMGPKVVGYYVEKIAKGKMTQMEYDKLVRAGVPNPGGEEYELTEKVERPLKVIYIR